MAEARTCPRCGAALPRNSPYGICPKCLLAAGMVSDSESQSHPPEGEPTTPMPTSSGFVPPGPDKLAEHFPQLEILELLGKGGMGAVYKARQRELDRLVAVKILPPEVGVDPAFAERFTREARALARLNHQNIVQVYDFGRNDKFFYFIMEFVDGVNLRHTIQAGNLEPVTALAIVPQICAALQFAHEEGIVHRDIKPENILIGKRGRVKIADFGLAKLLGQAPAEFNLTGTHQVMGTLHYMAPEQMQGSRAVDHRADIYSLGVVFYEMLTGQLPIGRFEPPSNKVQVDVRLDEVVLRSLESEPDRRYQHANDITTDLDALSSTPSQRPRPILIDSARSRRFTLLFTGFAVVLPIAAIEKLASFGISPIVTWPMAVLFIVVPASFLARRNRGTPVGNAATYVAMVLTLYPLYAVFSGFLSNSEPTLSWLYRTTGITPGPHDATVIRVLSAIITVTGLAISCFGLWYLWRLFRPEVRAGEGPNAPSSVAGDAERESSRPSRRVESELNHEDVRLDEVVLRSAESEPDRYQHARDVKIGVERVAEEVRLRTSDQDRTVLKAVARPGTDDSHRSMVLPAADALFAVASLSLACAIIGTVMILLQRWHRNGLQPATHVANSIHGVWLIAASMLMRRLKWRPFVLFSVVGVGIALPVFLALLWVDEFTRAVAIPVLNSPWLLFIPQWLGVPVAVWAFVVLLQPSLRDAFDAASIDRERLKAATLIANAASGVVVKPPAIGLIVAGALHGWWRQQHPRLRKSVNTVLLVVYIGGLLFFVSLHGSGNREAFDNSIGSPSPWYTVHKDASGFESRIHLFSTAWIMLAVGLLAFYLHWMLEQAAAETRRRFAFPRVHSILWSVTVIMGIIFCWLPFFLGAIDAHPGSPAQPETEAARSATRSAPDESAWVDLLADIDLTRHEVGFQGPALTNRWTRDESGAFKLTTNAQYDGMYTAAVLVPPWRVSGEYDLEATFILNNGDKNEHLAWPVIRFPVYDRTLDLWIDHMSGPSLLANSDQNRKPEEPLTPHIIAAGNLPVKNFSEHTLRLSVRYGDGRAAVVDSTLDGQRLVVWNGDVDDLPDKRGPLPQPGLIGLGACCPSFGSFRNSVTYLSARLLPITSGDEHDGRTEHLDLRLPQAKSEEQASEEEVPADKADLHDGQEGKP